MPGLRLAALALLAAALVPVSGCFTCVNQLDVHHCRDETGRCILDGQVVADWDPGLKDLFPDVDRLIHTVHAGEHAHADWSQEQTDAFWTFYQVPADRADKQVFLRDGDETFQVRVLQC